MEKGQQTDRVRLFSGIALSPEVREYVAGVSGSLSSRMGGVRWVPAANLHVTLKFFGSCDTEIIPGLAKAMLKAASLLPLTLSIGGTGGFPSPGSARVLWVGAEDPTGVIQEVYRTIDRKASKLGIPSEKRPYRPHITIGRAQKSPVRLPEGPSGDRIWMALPVGELVIYESVLKNTGAEYSVVKTISV